MVFLVRIWGGCSVQLLESNVGGVLPEASAADVQPVLPDEAVVVGAYTAVARARTMLPGVRIPDIFTLDPIRFTNEQDKGLEPNRTTKRKGKRRRPP
uniref:Putative ribosomal protein s29 n=1 Tax=Ixodes ricinus TaxID=34613 RepID=A0A0K8R5E4_IXORI